MGLDLSGTELSYNLCLLFEGMGMEDCDVVEGISHPYVAKRHLVSGQVKEKEGKRKGKFRRLVQPTESKKKMSKLDPGKR